jgi:DNA mismatch endonuclease, patch repair protein
MRAIRSKGMKPEMLVRRLVRSLGFGYRLHRKDLPGKPDLAFIGRKKAIFVHGCFWHQHPDCREGRLPGSNLDYWRPKLERNVQRDAQNLSDLERRGWRTLVIWECQTKDADQLRENVASFLRSS